MLFLSLFSASSVDDFLSCESEVSSKKTLTSSSQRLTHSKNLRSRPTQPTSCFSTRSTLSSISAMLRQHAQPHLSTSQIPSLLSLSDNPISLRPSSGFDFLSLFTHTQDPIILLETKNQSFHLALIILLDFHIIRYPKFLGLLQLIHIIMH